MPHQYSFKAPHPLITKYLDLFSGPVLAKPVLDLACGDGHNGLFLATRGLAVVLADRSDEALAKARRNSDAYGLNAAIWKVDFEAQDFSGLCEQSYGAILVFRYLFRPLIPQIRKALVPGGLLIYETFTLKHLQIRRTFKPEFLLHSGELQNWFRDWEIMHSFEGALENPQRAAAQLVCRRPGVMK